MCRLAAVFLLMAACAPAQTPAARDTVVAPELLGGLQWRGIGPAATGGRIADLAAGKVPGQPAVMYVATASGGVFKSANEGVSFTPVFDRAGGMMSIGAVAVAPSNPSTVWVGTGEADNRQSSSWGDGVYKSVNGGLSWKKMGLDETRHIGRILVHPTDPNTVWIAAVGHLWGSNPERGVYKTTDGGATWNRVLYKDDNTGAIDLAMDPRDPDVIFAAMYQRQRKGWGFNGGGPGSGIYRTTDGGATWTELVNGLPRGDKGRIGLAAFPGDSRMVYAVVEADAAGIPGGGVFRSTDRGDTWEHLSALNPRPMYYSRIYVDPRDANRVYLMGSNRGLWVSDNGGRNFREIFSNVHGEDHAMWIDPDNTNRLVAGGDGGVSISYDRGLTWLFRGNLPIGQFYRITVNNRDPYLICGGLQDNGNWCTPSASRMGYGISFQDAFNIGAGDGMETVFEGDDHTILVSSQNGATARLDLDNMERQVIGTVEAAERPQPAFRWYWTTPLVVSRFDPDTIYTGANILFRSDDRGVSWRAVSPDLTANIDRERLQMMGGPVPPRALSRHDGQIDFSALTAIAESPLDRNLLYTGADDGTIQTTRDGGKQWTNLTGSLGGLPAGLNISGIVASKYAAGRVYVTADGHFNDDYHPYIFVSEDYGRTWRGIAGGLPLASVHRLREHPTDENLLVAGLETGVYASFDRGTHWTSLGANLPPVPVYDLVYQERDNALVAGTHGRGIWILDHVEPLAQITPQVLRGSGFLFAVPPAHYQNIYSGQYWFGAGEFFAPNPPSGAVISYYLPAGAGEVRIDIADSTGRTIRALRGPSQPGINRTCWDLRRASPLDNGIPQAATCSGNAVRAGPVVLPGPYTVTVTPAGGAALTGGVTVLPDPHFRLSDADRRTRDSAVMSVYSLEQQLAAARDTSQTLYGQIAALRASLATAGDSGRAAAGMLDRVAAQAVEVQGQLTRSLTSANNLELAIDGYQGLPTAAQLREIEWTWEDTVACVTALNRLIQQDLPPLLDALGGASRWTEIPPAPLPVRR
jgi:photosystem II stability/assembly factor-like uncharacterized protein